MNFILLESFDSLRLNKKFRFIWRRSLIQTFRMEVVIITNIDPVVLEKLDEVKFKQLQS